MSRNSSSVVAFVFMYRPVAQAADGEAFLCIFLPFFELCTKLKRALHRNLFRFGSRLYFFQSQ